VDPQVRKLFRDDMFNNLLQGDEKNSWDAFCLVSTDYLGNIRAENYKELLRACCHFITNLVAIRP
jgi:hypothetical protein